MRRTLTIALILITLAFWGAGLFALTPHLAGTNLLQASAPAAAAALLLIGLIFSGRIFNPNDSVRRIFSAALSVTLLLTFALVLADAYLLSGELFLRGLELWRLDIYFQERFALSLAFAAAVVHPVLFILTAVGLLCLPPPSGFTMRR